jgi:PAS domain S-box-containing protein
MGDLHMDSVVCSYAPDFKLIYVNAACCRFFGKTRSQLMGADLVGLIPEADEEVLRRQVASLSPENPIDTFVQKHESSEDVDFWRLWHTLAVFDNQGHTTMYQTFFVDTKDSQNPFSRLGQSENRYRAVVEDQSELVCRYTPEFILAFCNEAYCSHFGKNREQLIGQNILEAIREEDRVELREFVRTVSPDRPNATRIQCITNSRGKKLWLEWRRRAFFDDEDCLQEIQAVGRDITELKNTEEALRTSEQALRSKNVELERKNIALEEVLNHIELQKQEIKENVVANIDNSLLPILERFRTSTTDTAAAVYIDLLENSLNQIASSFGRKVTRESLRLSPKEIEIANLIAHGLTGKEIANLLHISINTVGRHRNNIRRKANITNEKINLGTYLRRLS